MARLASRNVTLAIIMAGVVLFFVGLAWIYPALNPAGPTEEVCGPYNKGPMPTLLIAVGFVTAVYGIARGVVRVHRP
jgi:hypothetical protein